MRKPIGKVLLIGLFKMMLMMMSGIGLAGGWGAGRPLIRELPLAPSQSLYPNSTSTLGIDPIASASSGEQRVSSGHSLIQRLLKSFAPGLQAQSAALQQLLLDVTKLSQFKQILSDLQQAYTVLNKGYNTIKSIAAGNFSLHKAFIDGLLLVNPALAKYRRVADIIQDELTLVAQYKKAFAGFKSCGRFRSAELNYMGKVYSQLVDKSLDNLDALTTVLTAGKLRMSDDERLTAINRLYKDTHGMLQFILDFNRRVSKLASWRAAQANDSRQFRQMQGLDQ